MADDRSNRGSQDRNRISLGEDYEVQCGTKELGISKEKLTELVHQHGNSAKRIREALGR